MGREISQHTLSQNDKIINYLKKHGSISQYEATQEIGCYRLPARISDLKKKGYVFKTEIVTTRNRDGHATNFAKYSLLKE